MTTLNLFSLSWRQIQTFWTWTLRVFQFLRRSLQALIRVYNLRAKMDPWMKFPRHMRSSLKIDSHVLVHGLVSRTLKWVLLKIWNTFSITCVTFQCFICNCLVMCKIIFPIMFTGIIFITESYYLNLMLNLTNQSNIYNF